MLHWEWNKSMVCCHLWMPMQMRASTRRVVILIIVLSEDNK